MKKALLVMAVVAIGGCSFKSDVPPPVIYALRAQEREAVAPVIETVAVPGDAAQAVRVLQVARPVVPPGFDTDRIALYRDGGAKLDYYAGARWPDIFDAAVQDFMVRAAGENLPYVVAGGSMGGLGGGHDARLLVRVIDMQPVYRGGTAEAPEIVVAVEFTLQAAGREGIVDSFILTRRQAAAENRLDGVMALMNGMLAAVAAEAFARLDADLRAIPVVRDR